MARRASTIPILFLFVLSMLSGVPGVGFASRAATPDGFVGGREHETRVRPVLGELPALRGHLAGSARRTAAATVLACDPVAVTALPRVPTTVRSGDDPGACVVLGRTDQKRSMRLLLGPAYLAGGDLGRARARDNGSVRNVVVPLSERGRARWGFVAGSVGATPVAMTLDGRVIGVQPVTTSPDGTASFVLSRVDDVGTVADRIEQARSEEVIELGRMASMTRRARQIYAATAPRIDERTRFGTDCPVDEAKSSVVLGCYGAANIYLLRVDRPDLAGVMTVTAAHEMLHAVYASLDPKERRRVDAMIAEYLVMPDPRVSDALAEYDMITGSDKQDEAHSLVGTLVRDLPPPLAKYYARYFEDRGVVVDAYEAYQHVFDSLQAAYDQLVAEVDGLAAELAGIEQELNAASAEADRLFREIESLRAQDRVDESNALVDQQNAAAGRANSLNSRYNSLVASYNAKVNELNDAALNVNAAYEALTPIAP